ncbi:ferritin-like domain-containing protein [Yinghuangia sp. KLBMP8922]|uniref:Ferritin-like domain-containing protein n=1 Tax=Yinghuangia soli TaxID=2908204 RepID=A0AA41Q4Y7_9ACTN|nr:ferritin-like domain-containing protein [Yinghuangia soli]
MNAAAGGTSTGDLQVVALATALENQAVAAYQAAGAGKRGTVQPAVASFAATAMAQHADHAKAWNAVNDYAMAPTRRTGQVGGASCAGPPPADAVRRPRRACADRTGSVAATGVATESWWHAQRIRVVGRRVCGFNYRRAPIVLRVGRMRVA